MKPCYAIIPAAGSSRRMGLPKLLLPWPAGDRYSVPRAHADPSTLTVIDRVLEAWTTSRVTETIVVIRREDVALREACRRWPVTVVHPEEETRDMKESICVGLRHLMARNKPKPDAGCFLAPADLPMLSARVINGLIDVQSKVAAVRLPRFGMTLDTADSGHPALLPWEWTSDIFALGPQDGVDSLIKRFPQEFVLFPPELAASDIDTPADYQSAVDRATGRP